MTSYLLDTNILLRFCDATSPQHLLAVEAVATLVERDEVVCITGQNLVEFWAVTTRPIEANGFGWSLERAAEEIIRLLGLFDLLDDSPEIFAHWLQLVRTHAVQGKQAHDTRLVAVMLAHDVTQLLTFNTSDFKRYSEITIMHPQGI